MENRTAERLIPAGPDQDTGMVLIPLVHRPGPVHHHGIGFWPVSGNRGRQVVGPNYDGLPDPVRLQIGLVDHIEAQPVAIAIEDRLIGIVAGSDRIDIVALHDQQIIPYVLFRDCPSPDGAELMPVDPLKDDSLPIEAHDPFSELKSAKAHRLLNQFQQLPVGIQKTDLKTVEIGILGGPESRLIQAQTCPAASDLSLARFLIHCLCAIVALFFFSSCTRAIVNLFTCPACTRAVVALSTCPVCPRAVVALSTCPACTRAVVALSTCPACLRAVVALSTCPVCLRTIASGSGTFADF